MDPTSLPKHSNHEHTSMPTSMRTWQSNNRHKSALGRPRVDLVALGGAQVLYFWAGGSQGPPRARGLVQKKKPTGAVDGGSATPWAEEPANVSIPKTSVD